MNHFGYQPKGCGCTLWIINSQNHVVNNQNDSFMHFLAMSRNGQVATDGCNEQGFLW
jgi:hypothetical protein